MKKQFLLLMLALLSMSTFAADIIITTAAEKLEVKIEEVSETAIRYKKMNNLKGPTFVLSTNKISSIIFENGDVQVFEHATQPQAAQSQILSAAQPAGQTAGQTATVEGEQKPKFKLQFNPQPSDNYVWGLTVGYVSKQMKGKGGPYGYGQMYIDDDCKSFTPALRVGFTVNPTFKYGLGVRTGFYMDYAYESMSYGSYGKIELHDITFSMPLQISYRYEIIKKLSVMIYTGPVFDFGAYLKRKGNQSYAEEEGITTPNLYNYEGMGILDGTEKYSGFNCSWGIGAGVQWDFLRLDVGGEFGMVNKFPDGVGSGLYLNKPVYVTLTTFF